jgi:hypothetical protein
MENKQCGESIWDEPSQTTPKVICWLIQYK